MRLIFQRWLAIAPLLAWCSSGFAEQAAIGPGIIPLNATGVLEGVDMSVSGVTGTLTVGVVGGPRTDIFTLNNPVLPGTVAVSTAASSEGNIVFNSSSTVFGDIGITQPGGPFLRALSGGNAGTEVNFQGSVFATTLDVIGTGAVNFNSGAINITATNFAADGRISLAPNTTLIGALTTTAGANTGTLALGGGSVLDGAVGGAVGLRAINVDGGSNAAGVSATITGATSAFSFDLGTNTLNIGGALTIANSGAGGVINTTLASPTVFGNIRPVGATNLGPTLGINVLVPSTAFIPVGTRFNIVQTQTGTLQSGTDGSVLLITVQNPTNPLYTFSAVPLAGTVAELVTIETTGIPLLVPLAPTPDVAQLPNQPIAAAVVPPLLAANQTPDLLEVLAAINALSDPAAVVSATSQLAPSTTSLAASLVTFQASRQFQNLWLPRLADTLCGQVGQPDENAATCRDSDPHNGWWLKGFAHLGEQDARRTSAGYDSRIIGTMLGFDVPIGPNTRAGLGVGYARSTIDGNTYDAGTDTDFDTYQATVYAGHEQGPWYLYGNASFGWNEYSGTRRIEFPGIARRAEADYDGQDYSGYATAGYRIPAATFTVTPFASIQYSDVRLDDYTETGAGDVSLDVGSETYDVLEAGLGVKVASDFRHRGRTYVPEVHFKWLNMLNNPTPKQTATYTAGSPAFLIRGLHTSDDTFNVGGGLTLLTCACGTEKWTLEAGYDYEWRDDGYSAHQAMMRVGVRF